MQQRRKIRYLIAFVLLMAGILVLLLCNIGIGTVKIPLAEILTTGRAQEGMNAMILLEIRFPGHWRQQFWVEHWHWQGICFRHFSTIP